MANFILLISLFLILLLFPFIQELESTNLILKIILSIIMVTAVFSTTHKKHQLVIASILGLLALGSNWNEWFQSEKIWLLAYLSTNILFIGYITITQFIEIISRDKVNTAILSSAASVYVLFGLLMAFIYMLVDIVLPNAFSLSAVNAENFFQYLYLSFVTMTTLGYGDIVPKIPQAQALCYLQAIIGQLYLTFLVARLVGLTLMRNSK